MRRIDLIWCPICLFVNIALAILNFPAIQNIAPSFVFSVYVFFHFLYIMNFSFHLLGLCIILLICFFIISHIHLFRFPFTSIYTITHILLSVIHCFVSLLCISWCKFYVGLCIVHHFPLYIFASLILQNSPYSFSHHITILIFHLIRVSLADLIHCFTSSFFHQLGVPSSLLHLIRFLFVGSFAGFHFEFGIFERIIIV